jgi:hypothetical protein
MLHHSFVKQLKKSGHSFSLTSLLTEASRNSSRPLLAFDENIGLELCELVKSQLQLFVGGREKNVDFVWQF